MSYIRGLYHAIYIPFDRLRICEETPAQGSGTAYNSTPHLEMSSFVVRHDTANQP
jgi:hypothetical protein